MYSLTGSPGAFIQIFTSLCLSQVKEQLTENLHLYNYNPTSFTCNGQLFSCIANRSAIIDESLTEYGINLNFRHHLN